MPPGTTRSVTHAPRGSNASGTGQANYIIPLQQLSLKDLALVGGKNASLGEMISQLASAGVAVPGGFAITSEAFGLHLREAGLSDWVYEQLAGLDASDAAALAAAGARIRQRIAQAPLPAPVREQMLAAYTDLSASAPGGGDVDVAVRSSATAEDLPTASFAGQHETFLNVRGAEALDRAARACMASLFTDRAIVYREQNHFEHRAVLLSVGVQRMVRSDAGCAGTMFTLDTESGFRGIVLIEGSWGLGESVVQGRVSPDEFLVHKEMLRAGHHALIRRELGDKAVKLVYAGEGAPAAESLQEVPVADGDRARFTLTGEEALTLARWAVAIEEHYSRRAGADVPMDIEWAKDGQTGELFILQARPETVHAQRTGMLEVFRLTGKGVRLLEGRSVGSRIGSGPVRIVRSSADLPAFREGEVLAAPMTDPDWEPVLRKAAAVITERGGRTCHAAIVSREMGLPCVVGAEGATTTLSNGQKVTVSCAEGDVGRIYDGAVPFEREEIDPAALPTPGVPLMLNLADPGRAFHLGQLPAALVSGVGLMRIEFLVSNWIGIHPMALAHPERIGDAAAQEQIRRRAAGYGAPATFFIERLASGIGQIAAAFYPRPVIVRFSDFKTNEYARLLGGEPFEPVEANPMLGFRGASRYYDERYRDGFALECAAIRWVREEMGLTNVTVMIPFCRTLEEGRRVLAEMERHGLRRGDRGFQVYVMCEIPNNVVLAGEFSELFDGFSIGSNDLTQLTLGVDRDSDLLAHIFDERDSGVKRMIEMVIERAHAHGRPVGICGEAPSNHPDFAEFLASAGIDSMSLNPDSLPRVARAVARSAEP